MKVLKHCCFMRIGELMAWVLVCNMYTCYKRKLTPFFNACVDFDYTFINSN